MGPDHEHVFVRGTDGNVYQQYWTATGGWKGWFDIGAPAGGFAGAPATVSRNTDVCNVYVRGNDDKLWQRAFFGGQWHPWARHADGVLASVPALGSMGPDHEHVFVRGTDGNVYQKYWQLTAQPVGEVSFAVSECVYGWTARYRQSGTQAVVRIQLNPAAGISVATMDALRATWRAGIIATWSDRFRCQAPNGSHETFTVDVQWVSSNAHHVVAVQPGPARSNMTQWDTSDTGDVAAHEFGHMVGHPDEYVDATCPARSPVGTGTVMDDNTETVARLYSRLAGFHGSGHAPVAVAPEPPVAAEPMEVGVVQSMESLTPEQRQESLSRLQAVAAGDTPEGAHDVEVAFEVSGGAPGERYLYRVAVSGDGTAERRYVDELRGSEGDVADGTVGRELAVRVFAAARDVGLLDDAVPRLPGESDNQIVPDSMVAVVTVRDGDTERRIAVRAADPADAAHVLPGESSELPLDMDIRLVAESASALQPLLDALRGVEAAL